MNSKTKYILIKEDPNAIDGIELFNLNCEPFVDRARFIIIRPFMVEVEAKGNCQQFEQRGWIGQVYRKREDVKTVEVTFSGNTYDNIIEQLKSHELTKRNHSLVRFRQKGSKHSLVRFRQKGSKHSPKGDDALGASLV